MWSFLLRESVWVTVLNRSKPCGGQDIITHLQITMMEALKPFTLLSSQKAAVAWRSCILMSSELHHTQRHNREINMNKPKRAYWPRTTSTLNNEFVRAVKMCTGFLNGARQSLLPFDTNQEFPVPT